MCNTNDGQSNCNWKIIVYMSDISRRDGIAGEGRVSAPGEVESF